MVWRFWTESEEQYLLENHSTETLQSIAGHLNRSVLSIRGKSHKLGLKKNVVTLDYEPPNISTEDIIYIAGLFDGDGSLGLYRQKSNGYYTARLSIGNNHKPTIDWIHGKLGGGAYHPANPPPKRPMNFVWNATSRKQCQVILELLLPYLKIKKRQAEVLLQYYRGELSAEYTTKELKLLKKIRYEVI